MMLRGLSILRIRSCIQSLHYALVPIEAIHRRIDTEKIVLGRRTGRRFDGGVSAVQLAWADASGSESSRVQDICK